MRAPARRAQANSLLAMAAGFLIWTLYFLFCYGFLSLGCALDWGRWQLAGWPLMHLAMLAVTVLTLLALAWLAGLAWRQRRACRAHPETGPQAERQEFMSEVALWIHGLSAVAVLWVAAPLILRIPPCLS